MTTDTAIGRRVAALMDARGITQTMMARQMGVTQAAISRKLSGERPWFADELALAARLLGVQVGELFGEDAGGHRRPGRAGAGAAGIGRGHKASIVGMAVAFSG